MGTQGRVHRTRRLLPRLITPPRPDTGRPHLHAASERGPDRAAKHRDDGTHSRTRTTSDSRHWPLTPSDPRSRHGSTGAGTGGSGRLCTAGRPPLMLRWHPPPTACSTCSPAQSGTTTPSATTSVNMRRSGWALRRRRWSSTRPSTGAPLALLAPLGAPGDPRPRLPGRRRPGRAHPPPTTTRAGPGHLQRGRAPVRGPGRPAGRRSRPSAALVCLATPTPGPRPHLPPPTTGSLDPEDHELRLEDQQRVAGTGPVFVGRWQLLLKSVTEPCWAAWGRCPV